MLTTPIIDPIVENALREDLAGGDLSAEACVDEGRRASAVALAKSPVVVCGAAVFRRVFELLDTSVRFEALVPDGEKVPAKTVIWRLEGPARILLMGERTALNLVQRMSGTATLARACVDAVPRGAKTRITDTRKTTPGMRVLDRYAVRIGGAHNHRNDLGSAVMIKDNHIVASGGITVAIERARARAPHTSRVEVEVTDLEQLDEAVRARADIVMLDNFDDELTKRAVEKVRTLAHPPILEASGGITLERIARLAAIGVDVISVGALTHSAPAADISLDLSIS
ncbi:MAG: carboxylating nicotinate-nucleotide diphosphorylase [Polyangiaceae bacterium]|nr:carboxylating nicotinate-nucleotide diphosphorylase [Polyangiaceae bacterium]